MAEAKPEEAKAEAKPEDTKEEIKEKAEENAEEKKEGKGEEKKEEEKAPAAAPPSPPVVLLVDMHCVGCAKRVERCIMKVRGVEEVKIEMSQNQVTIKGVVDPQAICMRIEKKTKRRARVLSPLPPPEADPAKPQFVSSQVSGITTLVLHINMHCEACAEQLKRKILKMRGVQSAETDLSSGKVAVTGTMDSNRLVDYVYRRTRKLAKIVAQAEEEKKEEEAAVRVEEPEKPAAEEAPKGAEETKEEKAEEKSAAEEKGEEADNEKAAEEKKEEEKSFREEEGETGGKKQMVYWPPAIYVIEQLPPPQLFSDENPNACCIS